MLQSLLPNDALKLWQDAHAGFVARDVEPESLGQLYPFVFGLCHYGGIRSSVPYTCC